MNQNTTMAVIAIVTALALLGVVIVTIPLQQQAYAQATTFTEREWIPFDSEDFVPCAAGGEGEVVHLTGELHLLIRATVDSADGFHFKSHINAQGLSGTGLTTGDKYQSPFVANFERNSKVGVENTLALNLRIIGQGNGNNFLLHVTVHETVHPDGTVTAFVDNFRIECK
jgi:hypothetical protein